MAHIYGGLFNHYNWKYVSLVTQNENIYIVVSFQHYITYTNHAALGIKMANIVPIASLVNENFNV